MPSDSRTPSLNARLISIGVSESYASLLAAKKRRTSLTLALRIEQELGIPVNFWATVDAEAAGGVSAGAAQ